MQKIAQRVLQKLAVKIVQRYHPVIIGVTGSVGKTTTKEMIVAVLGARMRVRGTLKSYNNELGLPLSIIGAPTPGRSLFGWLRLIALAKRISWSHDPTFPEVLVLEMGADHPGDIARLVALAPPKIGVLTSIGAAHAAFYPSVEAIAKEKRVLIESLPHDGLAVLNCDDDLVWGVRTATAAPVVGVGLSDAGTVRAKDVEDFLAIGADSPILGGVRGTLVAHGEEKTFTIPQVLGAPQVRALLSATAVGLYYGMSLGDIVDAARRYVPPPGRMRLLKGIKNTIIIDDCYNASPASMKAALETLSRVSRGADMVRYAVLGDMRELGSESPRYHAEVGALVPAMADFLITVGVESIALGNAAVLAGLPKESWIAARDAGEAGKLLQDRIKQGDIMLFKGSQNTIRLERAVKEVMAEPLKAKELLVRQSAEWSGQ